MLYDMNQNIDWLRERARLEANQPIDAGFILCGQIKPDRTGSVVSSLNALGKFVELSRRKRRLSLEALAEKADVDLSELVMIEMGTSEEPAPRTIHCLAKTLHVKSERLMELAGLKCPRDTQMSGAAVRFAARSESLAALSREEGQALQEFLSAMED